MTGYRILVLIMSFNFKEKSFDMQIWVELWIVIMFPFLISAWNLIVALIPVFDTGIEF